MSDLEVRPGPGQDVVVIAPTGTTLGSKVGYNTDHTRVRVRNTGTAPVTPAPVPTPTPTLAYTSSITGGVLTGKVPWSATVTAGTASKVEFYIDGVLRWTETFAPYTFNGDPGGLLDTTTLADGTHALGVKGYDAAGVPGLFAGGTVTISNAVVVVPPPPPATGDLPGWTLLLDEPFDTPCALGAWPGTYYGHNFSAYPLGWQDTANSQNRTGIPGGVYDPGIISVHDGMLDVWVHSSGGTHWVAVPTVTPGGVSNFLGMRTLLEFRCDSMHGYKAAVLLWPGSNQWPKDGEQDFPEGDFDRTISAFIHKQDGYPQAAFNTTKTYTDWHTAELEWIAGTSTKLWLDGVLIGTVTDHVPSTPMHWVIQIETSLSGIDPAMSTAGHFQARRVAMWKPA